MTLRLNGSTSGYVEIDAPAVAANNTLTLPSSGELVAATSGNINVTSINSLNYPTAGALSNRNKIINGDMRIDQRNAGAAITVNNFATYTVDRWIVEDGSDAVLSVQQTTDAPSGQGFTNSLQVTATTADTSIGLTQYVLIAQPIEGFNAADLNFGNSSAFSVTASFWVKATVAGQYSCTIYNNGASRINPQSFVINSSNTWERKTITFVGDTAGTWLTNNGRGIVLNIYLALGSTYLGAAGWNGSNIYGVTGQANAVANTNNIFAITGVQLEAGTVATPFERRSYGQELALCQRYYWKTYNIGTAPGTATAEGTLMFTRWNDAGNFSYNSVQCPVPMRAAPDVTGYTSTSTLGSWLDNGSIARAFSIVNAGSTAFTVRSFGSGANTTGQIYGHLTASSEL